MKIQCSTTTAVRFLVYLAIAITLLSWQRTGHAQQRSETNKQPATSPSPQPQQLPPNAVGDEQILINTDLISFNITVTDQSGRFVSGLPKSAFTILDKKQPQEISFFSDADEPISIGIIFDVSGSMSGAKIERARTALASFIQTSHPEDEYSLIGFNSRAEVLLERTRDADAVLRKFTYVQPHGDTALYDAVSLGIEKLEHGAYPRHVLLLITDGGENDSRYSFKEVRSLLEESGVMLYSVCVLDQINLAGKAGMHVQDTLNGLSEITGGRAVYPQSSGEMDEVFERIALELRHQYSIGYKPKDFTPDGKWHRVQVKVAPPVGDTRLSVHSREGYHALSGAR